MSSLFFVLGREPFKRGQRGLFGGKARITGNNVSFSERKCVAIAVDFVAQWYRRFALSVFMGLWWVVAGRTKRVWLPNVQTKRLYSDALEQPVQMKVTTYVLRCIDKAGGLDNYLLNVSGVCALVCYIIVMLL